MSLQRDKGTGGGSLAELEAALAQRTRELGEARAREAAIAEILHIIRTSPGDLQAVFSAVLENATRLCEAKFGTLYRYDGKVFYQAAGSGTPAALIKYQKQQGPFLPEPETLLDRVLRTRKIAHTDDYAAEPKLGMSAKYGGARSTVAVPMLHEDGLAGVIVIYRQEVRPFTEKQIELVQNFAAQAVIAIENARLLNELRESLERQTATSEVLKIISSSPGELAPVFDAMLKNATEICEAKFGQMLLYEDGQVQLVAQRNVPEALVAWDKEMGPHWPMPGGPLERLIRDKLDVLHISDVTAEKSSAPSARLGGARTLLTVPMRKDGMLIGAIIIYRQEVRPFSAKQIELLSNFAAQAVIAIENTRLLNELRQRTDDLTESLEQQTATSEVLQVISSSPGELEPVFQAMLANAIRICEGKFGTMFKYADGAFSALSSLGNPPAFLIERPHIVSEHPDNPLTRIVASKEPLHISDLTTDRAYVSRNPRIVALVEGTGARSLLVVPMLKEGELTGAFVIYRQEIRPFTDKQIELVKNFAAQAVIAVENTRLLNELRESLDRQTATADVLKVISSSPGDLQPVFQSMLENATKLCEASYGTLWLTEPGGFRAAARHGSLPAIKDEKWWAGTVFQPGPDVPLSRCVRTRAAVHVADMREEPSYLAGDPWMVTGIDVGGLRSLVVVPMLKDRELVGAIAIYRREVRPFTEKQVELVTNFAAQAVIAIENTRLLNELRQRTDDLTESLEQQTATSEVLQVVSSSPGDLQPVFASMLENAVRICGATFGNVYRWDGDVQTLVATHNTPPQFAEASRHLSSFGPKSLTGRMIATKAVVHLPDAMAQEGYGDRSDPRAIAAIELGGVRTVLAVPMLRDNELIGSFTLYRQEVRPFADKQIELVQNFAAQAVIAIENTRLLNELRQRTDDLSESLAQQTATSEVLKIISSSPGELEPVFQAMLQNATQICGAQYGIMYHYDNGIYQPSAMSGVSLEVAEFLAKRGKFRPPDGSRLDELARTKLPIKIEDIRAEQQAVKVPQASDLGGARSFLMVPMLKEGELVGAINIYRKEVRPFTDKQVDLVLNFAAQAVIAIENTRLLNELRQRTDDLTESLQQQTATSEVLRVISSSPGELEPVFQAMLENAVRICGAKFGALLLCEDEKFRMAALHGAPRAFAELRRPQSLFAPGPSNNVALAVHSKKVQHVADLRQHPSYIEHEPGAVAIVELAGARTLVAVPMLKDNEPIGVISIYRQEVRPFTDKQIELVTNFAAQAVIAIENARLLNELRQRTDDLTESLEQQTATSEVLKVISSSSGELQPVFEAMLENATRLCAAKFGNLYLCEGDAFRTTAMHNVPPAFAEARKRDPLVRPPPGSALRRMADSKRPVHVPDVEAEQGYIERQPLFVTAVELGGFHALLAVPMVKDGNLIGAINIYRQEAGPFSDKQIELVQNFAAQAVIAIENARLLNELRETLERQTATSEVLRVISSSPGELEPVFNAMLENATRICEAKLGTLFLLEDSSFRAVAVHGDSYYADLTRRDPIVDMRDKVNRGVPLDRVFQSKSILHIHDLGADEGYIGGNERIKALVESAGARSHLVVPMLKEGELVGAVVIYRQEVRPFSDKQIELVQNFAAQAVIAIENTRLLNELRESLEQQTATSEVLKVIASSTGELAPVFGALLANATQLCDASYGALWLREGDAFRTAALHGDLPQAYLDQWRSGTLFRPSPDVPLARVAASGQPAQIADLRASEAYRSGDRLAVTGVEAGGIRTVLSVPMFRDKELVGVIAIYRKEVKLFADKQIELVKNFGAQAVIAIENARLLNELRQRTDDLTESLQQQTATSDILEVISNSPTDSQPAFDTIVRSGLKLFPEAVVAISLPEGDLVKLAAIAGADAADLETLRARYPLPQSREFITATAILERREMDFADAREAPEHLMPGRQNFLASGYRAMTVMPMMRGEAAIGAISVIHRQPRQLSDKQRELLRTFASQAVIAIENTRLFSELRERTDDLTVSLEQQTATADVLSVMSRSKFDLEPILQSVVDTAARLCRADQAVIFRLDGDLYRYAAGFSLVPEYLEIERANPIAPGPGTAVGRAAMTRAVVRIEDAMSDVGYAMKEQAAIAHLHSIIGVPLLRDGEPIGVIALARCRVEPFTDREIELVTTFADQAVIAIENVRLFEEVQARTEDLAESLEQQTATADVLKVISRSTFDLPSVLNTLLDSAARLCRAYQTAIRLVGDDGFYHAVALHGYPPEHVEYMKTHPTTADRTSVAGRVALEGRTVHVLDATADPELTLLQGSAVAKIRTILGVPLMREGTPIGMLIMARSEVEPFTEKQIQLVTTFADQAVIAIENVRLFDEVQARTEDLQESLQQQTATADVLKVISRSTFDLGKVLQTLVESAARLSDADKANITREKNGVFFRAEAYGYSPEFMDYVKDIPIKAERGSGFGRALLEGQVVHIPDVKADPEYTLVDAQKLGDYRTVLAVPMLREGVPIGVLTLTRSEVRPFTDKQIALVSTFADQAAIAIENVRLFDEIQDKSRQLEEASKHKSQFLANMSHELRTPLNAILGYTELIADGVYGETPEKVQATVQRIMTNGRHLLGLINDVLDLSKIEAGQLTLSLTDYSMKDVVYAVYGAVEPLAAEKKLNFKAEIAPDMAAGHGDERRLTQVLLNLVGNAIKFTDAGDVVIKASQRDGIFSVAVCDTGPGISEDDQKKLFQEFQQADSSTTKKKGGTGLGLAISKKIVEMHGGRIWLESQIGKGSTFAFTVPTRAEQQKRQA